MTTAGATPQSGWPWRGLAIGVCVWLACVAEAGVPVIRDLSPRNPERAVRQATRYIILHTTEGGSVGSLSKLRANGESNYFIDHSGKTYEIIERRRVAYHAGRSMWRGRTNLDDVSLGIEVAGYHNREINAAQYDALRALIKDLQAAYGIPDEAVLSHSMVAYGAPNRWHPRSHRGRKRCGMLFATNHVRHKLGLRARPTHDPDVRAGRLVVGDAYLASVLYGGALDRPLPASAPQVTSAGRLTIGPGRSAWDIARDAYNAPTTRYRFPDGREQRGDEVRNWKAIPPGTQVVMGEPERENEAERVMRLGQDGANAKELAGEETRSESTIYFLADGRVRTGQELSAEEIEALPPDTGVLVGYVGGGAITAKRRAFDVCGVKWNQPSTFYRFPDGRLVPGDQVKETAIPLGTLVFFRN